MISSLDRLHTPLLFEYILSFLQLHAADFVYVVWQSECVDYVYHSVFLHWIEISWSIATEPVCGSTEGGDGISIATKVSKETQQY